MQWSIRYAGVCLDSSTPCQHCELAVAKTEADESNSINLWRCGSWREEVEGVAHPHWHLRQTLHWKAGGQVACEINWSTPVDGGQTFLVIASWRGRLPLPWYQACSQMKHTVVRFLTCCEASHHHWSAQLGSARRSSCICSTPWWKDPALQQKSYLALKGALPKFGPLVDDVCDIFWVKVDIQIS